MNVKVLAIVVVGILVVASGAGAAFFILKQKDKDDTLNWDGTHISNYDKFEYIGAGASISKPSATSNMIYFPAEQIYSDGEDVTEYKMVGITGSGQCEVIQFEDKDGNMIEQDANLISLISEKIYSIAVFSVDSSAYQSHSSVYRHTYDSFVYSIFFSTSGSHCTVAGVNTSDSQGFIIDNKNGNMYSLDTIGERIRNITKIDYFSFDLTANCDQTYAYLATNELLQFSFTDTELQIKTVLDKEQVSNFKDPKPTSGKGMTTDRFSNVISASGSYLNMNEVVFDMNSNTKFMKADHTFSTLKAADPDYDNNLTYQYQYAFNDIVYERAYNGNTLEYTAYLNANGQFVQTTAEKLKNICIGHTDTTGVVMDYTVDGDGYHMKAKVVKYDAETPWEYTVNTIDVETISGNSEQIFNDYIKNCAFNGTNVYCFHGDSLYDIDVETLEVTQIDSPNQIKSVTFDNDVHQVKITAVLLSTLQTVEGYIDESKEGNEKLIFEPYVLKYNDRPVICIAPINV